MIVGAGRIGDPDDPDARVLLDEAQISLRWDPAQGILVLPVDVSTFHFNSPAQASSFWQRMLSGVVIYQVAQDYDPRREGDGEG